MLREVRTDYDAGERQLQFVGSTENNLKTKEMSHSKGRDRDSHKPKHKTKIKTRKEPILLENGRPALRYEQGPFGDTNVAVGDIDEVRIMSSCEKEAFSPARFDRGGDIDQMTGEMFTKYHTKTRSRKRSRSPDRIIEDMYGGKYVKRYRETISSRGRGRNEERIHDDSLDMVQNLEAESSPVGYVRNSESSVGKQSPRVWRGYTEGEPEKHLQRERLGRSPERRPRGQKSQDRKAGRRDKNIDNCRGSPVWSEEYRYNDGLTDNEGDWENRESLQPNHENYLKRIDTSKVCLQNNWDESNSTGHWERGLLEEQDGMLRSYPEIPPKEYRSGDSLQRKGRDFNNRISPLYNNLPYRPEFARGFMKNQNCRLGEMAGEDGSGNVEQEDWFTQSGRKFDSWRGHGNTECNRNTFKPLGIDVDENIEEQRQFEEDIAAEIMGIVAMEIQIARTITQERLLERAKLAGLPFSTQEQLTTFVRNQRQFFELKQIIGKVVVIPKINIKVCQEYVRKANATKGSCEKSCKALHICKFYLFDTCSKQKEYNLEHNLFSDHNESILRHNRLHRTTPKCIKFLVSHHRNRNYTTLPIICRFYNNQTTCNKENCPHLHICKHFVENNCRFRFKCKRNHSLGNSQCMKILDRFALHFKAVNEAQIRQLLIKTLYGNNLPSSNCYHTKQPRISENQQSTKSNSESRADKIKKEMKIVLEKIKKKMLAQDKDDASEVNAKSDTNKTTESNFGALTTPIEGRASLIQACSPISPTELPVYNPASPCHLQRSPSRSPRSPSYSPTLLNCSSTSPHEPSTQSCKAVSTSYLSTSVKPEPLPSHDNVLDSSDNLAASPNLMASTVNSPNYASLSCATTTRNSQDGTHLSKDKIPTSPSGEQLMSKQTPGPQLARLEKTKMVDHGKEILNKQNLSASNDVVQNENLNQPSLEIDKTEKQRDHKPNGVCLSANEGEIVKIPVSPAASDTLDRCDQDFHNENDMQQEDETKGNVDYDPKEVEPSRYLHLTRYTPSDSNAGQTDVCKMEPVEENSLDVRAENVKVLGQVSDHETHNDHEMTKQKHQRINSDEDMTIQANGASGGDITDLVQEDRSKLTTDVERDTFNNPDRKIKINHGGTKTRTHVS